MYDKEPGSKCVRKTREWSMPPSGEQGRVIFPDKDRLRHQAPRGVDVFYPISKCVRCVSMASVLFALRGMITPC